MGGLCFSIIQLYDLQEGMKQHFDLGRALRMRYLGFLNDAYDRHEVSLLVTSHLM